MPDIVIGNTLIKDGLVLAPMAGVTDLTFRSLCREKGASLTVSEMISAKGVWYKDKKTALLAVRAPNENTYALQLFGSDPEIMAFAAKTLYELDPEIAIIDINMGCPMPKITGNGDGSALMRSPELAGKVVRAVSDAVSIPVTVKMRTGWDERSLNAPQLAAVCERNGASLICVHGRTREQLYRPPVDTDTIRKVKTAVGVPVVANGGIYGATDALRLLSETGCDGVAIGQGALGNPWIFSEVAAALNGKAYHAPEKDEIIDTAKRHVDMLCADKGAYIGVREARKHLGWYIKGMTGAAEARRLITVSESADELHSILDRLLCSEKGDIV